MTTQTTKTTNETGDAAERSMTVNTNSFAKTICSICYEDLKPIVEDLQAISVCGHVFHELCLQQWFEYSSSTKKCSCPVCKQSCTSRSANRLYFQSVGDPNESSLSNKESDYLDDPELLRGEVRRLEGKVSSLASITERQGNEIKQLNEELNSCIDKLNKEVALRNDAVEQKIFIQRLLRAKSEELDTVKLERIRLEERSMALAKELAALRLASDLSLDEDEVLKLASFGNNANSKDTIDVLRKSLVIRNKSYTELMAKCNQLGRGEARSSKELGKAKEKISKLKTRVQELAMLVEVKDNEALRALKASKKMSHYCGVSSRSDDKSNSLPAHDLASQGQKEQNYARTDCLVQSGNLIKDEANVKFNNITLMNSIQEFPSKHKKTDFAKDGATSPFPTIAYVFSECKSIRSTTDNTKPVQIKSAAVYKVNNDVKVQGLAIPDGSFDSRTDFHRDKESIQATAADDEANFVIDDDIKQVEPMLNIKTESPSPVPSPKQGDICFSGGFLGPDGANRYLGKWCKRGQNNRSVATTSTGASGDLIAVGSDGRGGTIKVLRSLRPSLSDGKENTAPTKKFKYGGKPTNLQSQGCLQIEHFFGRSGQ